MTIKELKDKIKDLPDDMEINLYADGEEPAQSIEISSSYGMGFDEILLISR